MSNINFFDSVQTPFNQIYQSVWLSSWNKYVFTEKFLGENGATTLNAQQMVGCQGLPGTCLPQRTF